MRSVSDSGSWASSASRLLGSLTVFSAQPLGPTQPSWHRSVINVTALAHSVIISHPPVSPLSIFVPGKNALAGAHMRVCDEHRPCLATLLDEDKLPSNLTHVPVGHRVIKSPAAVPGSSTGRQYEEDRSLARPETDRHRPIGPGSQLAPAIGRNRPCDYRSQSLI